MTIQRTSEHYDQLSQEYDRRWQGYLDNTHNRLLEVLLPDGFI